MNKKGYTLIELITIIALLSIVAIITIPKINKAMKTSRADQLEDVRENIVNATDVFFNNNCGKEKHKDLIDNGNIRIYLSDIYECGLIDKKIYNPMNGEYFDIDNEYVDAYIDEVGMIDYKLSF